MIDITKIDDDETADNEGVDRLAAAMKEKLKAKRLEGRNGWHNDCPVFRLKRMFNEHLNKGDVLDLANFAMMIWNRENPNATVARPEATSAWISVEERLPTESGWYQIWHTAMPSALNRSEQPAAFFYTTSPYWRYAGGGKVTHWMPLPLPPSPQLSGEPK